MVTFVQAYLIYWDNYQGALADVDFRPRSHENCGKKEKEENAVQADRQQQWAEEKKASNARNLSKSISRRQCPNWHAV